MTDARTPFRRAFYQSFYAQALYREVAQRWKGLGFSYLLKLLAAVVLPLCVAVAFLVQYGVNHYDFDYVIEQVPLITIDHGEVRTDVAQPYIIHDKEQAPLVVIDTLHPVTDHTENAYILGKTQTLYRHDHEARIDDISDSISMEITKDSIRTHILPLMRYAGIATMLVVYPSMLLAFFLYRALEMLLYGLIAVGMGKLLRVQLEYRQGVRLACVAITPVVVADMLALLLSGHIPALVFFLMGLVSLFCAVKAVSDHG